MLRLDGKLVAQARKTALQAKIGAFTKAHNRKPGLAVVIVGSDPASQVYVRNKVKTTTELGMHSTHLELPEMTSQNELLKTVRQLNRDPSIDGILVQLPLPKHIDTNTIVEAIDPEKDPDGLTTANLGLLLAGRKRVAPCTPWGVMKILEHYNINPSGKRVTVIGRSNIVGKPMAQLLMRPSRSHIRARKILRITRATPRSSLLRRGDRASSVKIISQKRRS
jgi:methylenetetrahydrofolate dehydrogenase (NADP+)/methenyltetrahydrofolate cyclohydrolase